MWLRHRILNQPRPSRATSRAGYFSVTHSFLGQPILQISVKSNAAVSAFYADFAACAFLRTFFLPESIRPTGLTYLLRC